VVVTNVVDRPFEGFIPTSLVVMIEYVVTAAVTIPVSDAEVAPGARIGV
jgi:hypothetical protein